MVQCVLAGCVRSCLTEENLHYDQPYALSLFSILLAVFISSVKILTGSKVLITLDWQHVFTCLSGEEPYGGKVHLI